MNRRRTRFTLALAALPLIFTLGACSDADTDDDPDSFNGDGEVPADTVEAQFASFLEDSGVVGATDISCEPVKDEVDATTTCTAVVDGVEGESTVTVAASDETSTTFSFDGTAFGIA